jgi:hypothetical protein
MTRHVIAAKRLFLRRLKPAKTLSLCWLYSAFLGLSITAQAEETLSNEMSAFNGTSELILTVKDCPIEKNHGYKNYGYVVESGEVVAEGCWQRNHQYVDIWFPAIKSHFQLNAGEFRPRISM